MELKTEPIRLKNVFDIKFDSPTKYKRISLPENQKHKHQLFGVKTEVKNPKNSQKYERTSSKLFRYKSNNSSARKVNQKRQGSYHSHAGLKKFVESRGSLDRLSIGSLRNSASKAGVSTRKLIIKPFSIRRNSLSKSKNVHKREFSQTTEASQWTKLKLTREQNLKIKKSLNEKLFKQYLGDYMNEESQEGFNEGEALSKWSKNSTRSNFRQGVSSKAKNKLGYLLSEKQEISMLLSPKKNNEKHSNGLNQSNIVENVNLSPMISSQSRKL